MHPTGQTHASRISQVSHIRGSSAFTVPASGAYRALAGIFDVGFGALTFYALYLLSRSLPVPSALQAGLIAAFALGLWITQKFLFGVTLGERIWDLRSQARFKLNPPLVQCQPVSSATQCVGIFLTLLSFIIALCIAYAAIVTNPLGMRAKTFDWDAFFPTEDRWTVMPFYYSLGAWPGLFRGHEIFYNLPYEKGPPERFAGEITARWDTQVRLVFEGPKSPLSAKNEPYSRSEIHDCVMSPWGSLEKLPSCLRLRSDVLGRHIDALNRLHPSDWEMGWVNVANNALSPDQELQGIYISAKNERRGQDRFILITAHGTHQAFILDYPTNEIGLAAREDFKSSLRSLRTSDDLGPGRAWVDDTLEKINLHDISQLGESESAVRQLTRIQSLLIARISVDPKTYDTYFHLGGTALMLGRTAVKLRRLPAPQGNPELAAQILIAAKPMIATAQHYAQDVSPKDDRNRLLQTFVAESQKF